MVITHKGSRPFYTPSVDTKSVNEHNPRRLIEHKENPLKNYVRTPVIATCVKTGAEIKFPSISEASIRGGFEIGRVQDCVQGFARTHAGYTFKADGPGRPARDRPRVREAYDLYQRGLTRIEVAEKMGLNPSTVGKYIKQGQIKWGAANA